MDLCEGGSGDFFHCGVSLTCSGEGNLCEGKWTFTEEAVEDDQSLDADDHILRCK